MAYKIHLGKLDWGYAILLLICLFLLIIPHINWNNKWGFRIRKTFSVVSERTIQVSKAWNSPNITQVGVYGSNDMDTCVYTCCVGDNCKLVSLYNEFCNVSPFLGSYQSVK